MCNVHVRHDCRRIQYTPSPSLEIILPVKLFVLFGYPLRWVNIGNLPLSILIRPTSQNPFKDASNVSN